MKVAVYSAKPYDIEFLSAANTAFGHELIFHKTALEHSTVPLAQGCAGVCAFVNDDLGKEVLCALSSVGVRYVALCCAGHNNVDISAMRSSGLAVCRVPAYSPHSVAEFTLALILTMNRKIHRSYNRVRENNFLLDGLMGFDLYKKTIGVVGTGRIGIIFAGMMRGIGCHVLAYDPMPNPAMASEFNFHYVGLDELFSQSDIVSLHCPLTTQTHHLINHHSLSKMRRGVMLINTSRGGLVDTQAVIDGLKSGQVGALGIDVYEEEGDLFFEDKSGEVVADDVFSRLLTLPNVLVTGHQAFFTSEAMENIAHTTLQNLHDLEKTGVCHHSI